MMSLDDYTAGHIGVQGVRGVRGKKARGGEKEKKNSHHDPAEKRPRKKRGTGGHEGAQSKDGGVLNDLRKWSICRKSDGWRVENGQISKNPGVCLRRRGFWSYIPLSWSLAA
jgi:hypothetical protein